MSTETTTEQARWTLEWLDASQVNPTVSNACAYARHNLCEGFRFVQVPRHTWYENKPCTCQCHKEAK